jgi:hypothetical protein
MSVGAGREIRIGPSFDADRRRRTVTGQNAHIIAERQNLFTDPGEKEVAIASGQIPAADSAREEHIAAEQYPVRQTKKTKAPRTMTGHFEHTKSNTGKLRALCFRDQKIGLDRLNLPTESELLEKTAIGQKWNAVPVISDAASMLLFDPGGINHVIDMAVREQEQSNFVPGAGQPLRRILRGVDQNAVVRQEKTVRVEDAASEGFNAHANGWEKAHGMIRAAGSFVA